MTWNREECRAEFGIQPQELIATGAQKSSTPHACYWCRICWSQKGELQLRKEITMLAKYEGLLIDEIGQVQQSREEMKVLFTLLAERYERGSVLLTSSLAFSRQDEIFKDAMTTAAAIDRLGHHYVILEPNIPS